MQSSPFPLISIVWSPQWILDLELQQSTRFDLQPIRSDSFIPQWLSLWRNIGQLYLGPAFQCYVQLEQQHSYRLFNADYSLITKFIISLQVDDDHSFLLDPSGHSYSPLTSLFGWILNDFRYLPAFNDPSSLNLHPLSSIKHELLNYLKSAFFLKKRETCDTVAHYVDLIVPLKAV